MQILATTSSVLRIVTDAAVTVDVFASYMDRLGATFTPGTQATAITTATTTDVVSAPAASTQRNVKSLSIYNKSDTAAVNVTVEFYDGSSAYQIYKAGLAPNETLWYEDDYGWVWAGNAPVITQQIYTTPGSFTYTTPIGVKAIRVECIGSGGGGGGVAGAASVSGAAGGGGAGAYAAALIQNPAATYALTVPSGGTGATAGANAGGAGSSTTFGSAVIAVGGAGGSGDTAAAIHLGGFGGAGGLGSACTGDDRFDGSSGGLGVVVAAALAVSGSGGNSYYVGGAIGVRNSTAAGGAGTKGSGGAGGCNVSGVAGNNIGGGAGGDGVCIVTEYR